MWRFGPGYLGACIVGVALLGGLLLGSIANVDTHTENTTAYEYKTDITGLFDVSQAPQYLDFNPATNYTGYTNTDTANIYDPPGIYYTSTNIANNYRMTTVNPGSSNSHSGTVNNSSNYPLTSFALAPQYSLGQGSPEFVNQGSVNQASQITGFKVTTLYDWVTSVWGALNQYQTIEITITQPGNNAPTQRGGVGGVVPMDAWGYSLVILTGTAGASVVFTVDCDAETVSYTAYGNTYTYSLYTYYIIYGNATQHETGYYEGVGGGAFDRSYSTELWFSYSSVVYNTVTDYTYMLPADGVHISTDGGATVWDNDTQNTNYDNYAVRFLFGPNFNSLTGQFDPINQINQHDTVLTLNKVGGGTDTFRIKNNNQGGGLAGWKTWLNGTYTALGDFPAVLISIEKSPYNTDGKTIKAYGVTSFTDYQTIEYDPAPLATWTGANYDLDNITITDDPNADTAPVNVSWLVYDTVIFMNTYNAVLSNPSINLADYWPDMTSYRFALKNIALYGDSITINNVTYPVNDQKITIGDKSYNLKNCYISYSREGDASITFNDVNKTVDLGATVSKVVSFGGNWGFSMGLYEGVASSKEVYDWDISLFGDGLNTCILIALGLLAVGAVICIYFKAGLKFTDKAVLGAGALILVMFLVV